MVLKYLNYDLLDVSQELEKIKNAKYAEIVLLPNDAKCLFVLGMLFTNGIRIKILNEKDLNFESSNKSFPLMSYVWSRLGDNGFPSRDYSNVINEIDKKIENVKRLGVSIDRINNDPIDNKVFLISPVRIINENQKRWTANYVVVNHINGIEVHAPYYHTRQSDLFGGYAICRQNAEAIATSKEVHIYYDKSSMGSAFDLGVSYALNKPLKLINKDICLDENNFIDSIIMRWPYKEKNKILLKEIIL